MLKQINPIPVRKRTFVDLGNGLYLSSDGIALTPTGDYGFESNGQYAVPFRGADGKIYYRMLTGLAAQLAMSDDNLRALAAVRDLEEARIAQANDASSFGNLMSPTLIIGSALRADDWGDFVNGIAYGNNGIVTDQFARNHPYLAMSANFLGDIAALGGWRAGLKLAPATAGAVYAADLFDESGATGETMALTMPLLLSLGRSKGRRMATGESGKGPREIKLARLERLQRARNKSYNEYRERLERGREAAEQYNPDVDPNPNREVVLPIGEPIETRPIEVKPVEETPKTKTNLPTEVKLEPVETQEIIEQPKPAEILEAVEQPKLVEETPRAEPVESEPRRLNTEGDLPTTDRSTEQTKTYTLAEVDEMLAAERNRTSSTTQPTERAEVKYNFKPTYHMPNWVKNNIGNIVWPAVGTGAIAGGAYAWHELSKSKEEKAAEAAEKRADSEETKQSYIRRKLAAEERERAAANQKTPAATLTTNAVLPDSGSIYDLNELLP